MTKSDRAKVLIVDPDVRSRQLLKRFLHGAHEIVEASDGVAALRVVDAERPGIVITEILTGRLNGLQICRELKKTHAEIHIVVLSFLLASERAEEAGADLFLEKPIQKEQLMEALSELGSRPAADRTAC